MDLKELAARLHVDVDYKLMQLALTHKSVATRNGDNNQRLEYLGDSVVHLMITDILYSTDQRCHLTEGDMTMIRGKVADKETLAKMAEDLGLRDLIKLSPTAAHNNARGWTSMMEDAMEALIGAVFIANGYEKTVKAFGGAFKTAIVETIKAGSYKDAKTALQDYMQARGLGRPKYIMDDNGQCGSLTRFQCSFAPPWCKPTVYVMCGRSKKAAQTAVAEMVLSSLNKG